MVSLWIRAAHQKGSDVRGGLGYTKPIAQSENLVMAQHDSMIADLKKVADEHEEAARHLFVVCGEPSTQEGFECAWKKEDQVWWWEWATLCAMIKVMEKGRAQNS